MQEFYNTTNAEYLEVCKNLVIDKKIKIEILDHYENTLSEITYDVSNIQGSISVDYQQGIRRSCNLTIRDVDGIYVPKNEDSVFFINRKFKIYLGIKNNDSIYWFSQGIFITTNVSSSNYELQITGKDKFAFFTDDLKQHILQGTYIIPKGTSIRKAISDTITIDMGNGYPTDAIEPLIDMDLFNETLPYDIKKDAGSTIGDILIEIATSLNCDIYYNSDGCLVVTKSCIDDYHKIAPQWVFGEHDSENLTTEVSYDMGGIINSITVCGNNTTGQIYEYTAKNEYPTSPLRISLIGVHANEIEETSMGYSLQRCKEYAEYKLKKATLLALSINKTCSFLPHLDVNKIIGLSDDYYGFDNQYFITQKLEMPIGNDVMNLSLCNINYLPFIETGIGEAIVSFSDMVLNIVTESYPPTFYVPQIISENANFSIDWGDNTPKEQYREPYNGINYHYYNGNGNYALTIKGGFLASKLKSNGVLSDCISAIIPAGVVSIENLFSYCEKLVSVNLPKTLTTIGDYSFQNCYALTSITIPNSVTSIGSSAFSYCTGLTSITIPNSVTSIGGCAFTYCNELTSITIPNSVTTIGDYTFQDCVGLISISIPDSITNLNQNIFRNCTSLTSVTIGNFVTNIGESAFDGCTGLTSITIPNSVTSIGNSVFSNCTGLTSITIPNSVTSIGGSAFDGCSSLISVTIPNSVVTISYNLFSNCTGLTSITIPNSVTSIGGSVFYGCTGLTSITIPNSVTSIGDYVFSDCTGLTSITIPNSVTSIGSYTFNGCTNLTSITIPDSVTSIGNSVFYSCTSLTSVIIGDSVASIEDETFYGCTGLTSIIIGNSVTSIGNNAFQECSSLTSITIPNSVTNIGYYAFYHCTSLTSITIPNISLLNQYTFDGCVNLASAVINASVISNYAFNKCVSLTSVTFGENVSTINLSSFSGCNALSQFTVSENNTKYSTSNNNMIIENGTKVLLSVRILTGVVTIPNGITVVGTYSLCNIGITEIVFPTTVITIEKGAFTICKSLTSVILPNGLKTISSSAFYNCSNLASVTFPSTVTSIGTMAFQGTKLTSVTIPTGCTYTASGTSASFPTGCVVHKV